MAQEVEDSQIVRLETPEDYKNAEKWVLESIEWLQQNPVNSDLEKRQELNAFIIKWVSGTSAVSIDIFADLSPADCPNCLIAFICGWIKYSLEHNYSKDKVEGALAGVERTIAFYEKNQTTLGKNPDVERLILEKKKGNLREFVEASFK